MHCNIQVLLLQQLGLSLLHGGPFRHSREGGSLEDLQVSPASSAACLSIACKKCCRIAGYILRYRDIRYLCDTSHNLSSFGSVTSLFSFTFCGRSKLLTVFPSDLPCNPRKNRGKRTFMKAPCSEQVQHRTCAQPLAHTVESNVFPEIFCLDDSKFAAGMDLNSCSI